MAAEGLALWLACAGGVASTNEAHLPAPLLCLYLLCTYLVADKTRTRRRFCLCTLLPACLATTTRSGCRLGAACACALTSDGKLSGCPFGRAGGRG